MFMIEPLVSKISYPKSSNLCIYIVVAGMNVLLDTLNFQICHQSHRINFIIQIIFRILNIHLISIFKLSTKLKNFDLEYVNTAQGGK